MEPWNYLELPGTLKRQEGGAPEENKDTVIEQTKRANTETEYHTQQGDRRYCEGGLSSLYSSARTPPRGTSSVLRPIASRISSVYNIIPMRRNPKGRSLHKFRMVYVERRGCARCPGISIISQL